MRSGLGIALRFGLFLDVMTGYYNIMKGRVFGCFVYYERNAVLGVGHIVKPVNYGRSYRFICSCTLKEMCVCPL